MGCGASTGAHPAPVAEPPPTAQSPAPSIACPAPPPNPVALPPASAPGGSKPKKDRRTSAESEKRGRGFGGSFSSEDGRTRLGSANEVRDVTLACRASGLRSSKLSDVDFGESKVTNRRSSTTAVPSANHIEENRRIAGRHGARYHSICTSFGVTRLCEWVNTEAEQDVSAFRRPVVLAEANLQTEALQFVNNAQGGDSWMGKYEKELISENLQKMLLFERLSPKQLASMMSCMTSVDLKAGAVACEQGDTDAQAMFILLMGALEVWVTKPNGEKKRVATIGPGGTFGEKSLLYSKEHTATVKAIEPSVLGSLSRVAYQSVLVAKDLVQDADEGTRQRVDALRRAAPFAGLPESKLRALAAAMSEGKNKKTAPLLKLAKGADFCMIITSGTADFTSFALPAFGPDDTKAWRLSTRTAHTSAEELEAGDVLGSGRPGDEGMLTLLQGLQSKAASKLKLFGVCKYPRQCALCKTDVSFLYAPLSDVISVVGAVPEVLSSPDGVRVKLQNCRWLDGASHETLDRLSYSFQPNVYPDNSRLLKQGERGNLFQIIIEGTVAHVLRDEDGEYEREVQTLSAYEHMGERSLLNDDAALADAIARGPVTTIRLGDGSLLPPTVLSQLRSRKYLRLLGDDEPNQMERSDFTVAGMLGQGSFAVVALVTRKSDGSNYALKMIDRSRIEKKDRMQALLVQERNVMHDLDHPFITSLCATFKTKLGLYMLLDYCVGGELFVHVREKHNGSIELEPGRFYIGCVVLAIEYLHARNIVHRDLKPENIVITENGYVKLIDFGFAKKLASGGRTYTLCGTPEYLAPEMILLAGHGFGVDWWAVGICLFDLLVGWTPFTIRDRAHNPQEVYKNITNPKFDIQFPSRFADEPELVDFICAMLRFKPMQRLGCTVGGPRDVRQHSWFDKEEKEGAGCREKFDWEQLYQQQLPAPFVPVGRESGSSEKSLQLPGARNDESTKLSADFMQGERWEAGDATQWDLDF